MTRQCTRGRRGLQVATTLTVLLFGSTQALAQTPAAPPASPAPTSPRPAASPKAAPAAKTPPSVDERTLDAEIPLSVEAPPGDATAPTPVEGPATPDATAAPDAPPAPEPQPDVAPPATPEPPPTPETATPQPPPPNANFGTDLLVKDEAQAKDLRRRGAAIMITGGVVTLAGVASSIAFTIRGTQFENLLVGTQEEYNRADCSSKVNVKMGSKCDQLSNRQSSQRDSIEFSDRATRAAGAAIAAGVIVTVVGGIVYRLGVKKLRATDMARVRMTPAVGRNFGGLFLTGRF